jgi:hypothetical protein
MMRAIPLTEVVTADLDWAVKARLNSIDKDIYHTAVVDQAAFKHQDRRSSGDGFVALEDMRPKDAIDRAVFVFEADKDMAFSSSGCLSCDHETGNLHVFAIWRFR